MSACGDRLDALDVDLVEGDAGAEGQARQQRELVRGVEAADVEGRVGLGIALGLRLRQHVGEGAVLLLHLGQDVVAGAVEDAVDAADLVAGERLAQRLDDGDAAGHRGLEVERDAVLLGEPRELHAVLGEQRLVGGDDVLAGRSAASTACLGDAVLAADQLDEDVDAGVGGEPTGSSNQLMPSSGRRASWARARRDADTTMLRPTCAEPGARALPAAAADPCRPCRGRRCPVATATAGAAGGFNADFMTPLAWTSTWRPLRTPPARRCAILQCRHSGIS